MNKREGARLWECASFTCSVGSNRWNENKFKNPKLNFKMCPFFIEYSIEIVSDPAEQRKQRYKLTRFVMAHSHPISLKYDTSYYVVNNPMVADQFYVPEQVRTKPLKAAV